jgi:uncharacterized protein
MFVYHLKEGPTMKRNLVVVVLFLLLTLGLSAGRVATAAPEELFFSEYVEGSANNKALEIYNGTGAAIDLAAGGYQVAIFLNGNTNPETIIDLVGTVADGDVFVVARSGADQAILDEADQTAAGNWFNGDDAVVLRKGTTVIDAIGQVGFDPGSEWGSGLTSTANNTLRRKSTVCAGDTISDDAFDPAVEWDGYAVDTFDGLGSHTAECETPPPPEPPAVVINEIRIDQPSTDNDEYFELAGEAGTALNGLTYLVIGDAAPELGSGVIEAVVDLSGQTIPASGYFVAAEGTFALGTADLTVNLNFENGDNVTHLLVWNFSGTDGQDLDTNDDGALDVTPWDEVVDLVALILQDNPPTSTEYHYGPPTVGPDGSFVPGHVFLCEDGWRIGAFDPAGGDDTPGAANDCTAPPPPDEVCGETYTPIYDIQGSGSASPLDGSIVSTEGVVVGDFQPGDGDEFNTDLGGFFIQDPAGDGNAATSDGIFVFAPSAMDVQVGDGVRVRGEVDEFFGMTQLTNVTALLECSTGNTVAPTPITLATANQAEYEPYEGMLVTFPQTLSISEYFNFDRFNEIVLTDGRQFQPTAVFDPDSAEAAALAAETAAQRITLDDGRSAQNPDPAWHPNGMAFTLANRFRGGDTLTNVTGVLNYSFNLYRIQPTTGADYTAVNTRPAAPDDVGGEITVAAFNVLNYFLTIDTGPDICGPLEDMDCRGADTVEEFERQRTKILSALLAIDADVFGFMEMENTPGVEPLADIVAGLNAALGAGTYAYIDTGVIGTDAIRNGIIYKPGTVELVGDVAVLDDPAFVNPLGGDTDRSRPAVAASFMDKTNGGVFTVAVNHLKSKGSACPEEGTVDPLQGNCNLVRALGAEALVDWLATDPTGSGSDNNLIIGDLNSYDKEDPIDVVKLGPDDAAGTGDDYFDLLYQYIGEYAYTYVFDGQLGYLDYAMANIPLLPHVTGATVWHINADEPDILDYDMTFKKDAQDALYEPNAYRSSDHDPVIVGLAVCETVAPTLAVTVSPERLWPPNNQMVTVEATVSVSDNFDASPQLTLVSVVSSDPGGNEDIVIVDDDTFQLRAERVGRTYTITYQAMDACGNTTTVAVTVTVGPSVVLYLPIIAKP